MDKLSVYVAGFPKSGTTWITRLIGDLTNSPTGGFKPSEDSKEIATEGSDREGPFIIRKGHYVIDPSDNVPAVSVTHRLGYKNSEVYRVIFVVRDPRDVAVSASFYWRTSIPLIVEQMIKGTGHFRSVGSWDRYVSSWLDLDFDRRMVVRYEDMHEDWRVTLYLICNHLGYAVSSRIIDEVYERQTFQNRVKDIVKNGDKYPLGKEFNLRFMRRGVVGDWRSHIRGKPLKDLESYFGHEMSRLGYK